MFFGEISFYAGDSTILKDNATVSDLIDVLRTFPADLPVSAAFRCLLDAANNIVCLEDEKVNALLDIMLECPSCRLFFQTDEPTVN